MTNEDPVPPELAAQSEANARSTLVRAEALAALAACGCVYPDLFSPSIERELKAIYVADDVGFRVFAVDGNGNVITGERGPATARDVVARARAETPEMFRPVPAPHVPGSGTTRGRSYLKNH